MNPRALLGGAAVAALLAGTAAPADPAAGQAELGCATAGDMDTAIEQAPGAVFVGTVRALVDKGRTATVDVIRVWKGGPVPKRVEVQGTMATQSKVVTANDRLYARDRTYLFLPTAGASPRFREDRCSATRELTTELAAKQPPGALPPEGEGVPLPGEGLGKFAPLMVGSVALVILGGLLAAARRRTVRARQPDPAG